MAPNPQNLRQPIFIAVVLILVSVGTLILLFRDDFFSYSPAPIDRGRNKENPLYHPNDTDTTNNGNTNHNNNPNNGNHHSNTNTNTSTAMHPSQKTPDWAKDTPFDKNSASHWSKNPRYQGTGHAPRMDVPEERQDAIVRIEEGTYDIILQRDPGLFEQARSIFQQHSEYMIPHAEEAILSTRPDSLRTFYASMLSQMALEEYRAFWVQLLDDDAYGIRFNALRGLGYLGGEEALPYLESMTQDENQNIAREAERILEIVNTGGKLD